jgi:hypothetical protein
VNEVYKIYQIVPELTCDNDEGLEKEFGIRVSFGLHLFKNEKGEPVLSKNIYDSFQALSEVFHSKVAVMLQ